MAEIIFIGDPMCSWCWGFEPHLHKLRLEFANRYDFDIIMGGLRESMPWDEASKSYLKNHWQNVHKATNQPFDNTLFEREDFIYNTFIPSKAVVTIKALAPQNLFAFYERLQEAFYRDGEDITDKHVLASLATDFSLTYEQFISFFESDDTEKLMHLEFQKARLLGANSFPSLVIIDDEGHLVTLKGYRKFEDIVKFIK